MTSELVLQLLKQECSEGSTTYLERIYRKAKIWVFHVKESDIPESGPMRDVWKIYQRVLKYYDLEDEGYMLRDDRCLNESGISGLQWNAMYDIICAEIDRRRKTGESMLRYPDLQQ